MKKYYSLKKQIVLQDGVFVSGAICEGEDGSEGVALGSGPASATCFTVCDIDKRP